MIMCPNSPAMPCAPVSKCPSTRMPPPTPVPTVITIEFFSPEAAPSQYSPSAAQFASFPTYTGIFNASSSASLIGVPSQLRICAAAPVTTPVFMSICPVADTPAATTFFSLSESRSSNSLRNDRASSLTVSMIGVSY